MLTVSSQTRRQFILGLQGLYPGRRWQGKQGVLDAFASMGELQIDPLNVIARSHDIALWGRVVGYQTTHLSELLYEDRKLFDYGGTVAIHPMEQLPYWRLVMERRKTGPRYLKYIAEHQATLDEVLGFVQQQGESTSRMVRDTTPMSQHNSFRTTKVTGQALYHLWLTGELMTARRNGFERVYDLYERVAPAAYQHAVTVEKAEDFFTRTVLVRMGMATSKQWRSGFAGVIERRVTPQEATQRLAELEQQGEITAVRVEGEKEDYWVRIQDFPLLETLHTGQTPSEWTPLSTNTSEEVTFLAPLEIVSARGRAKQLFAFDYIWEVYKPAAKRKFGYYTLPILYRDQLVGRIDPKLDRPTQTLHINGPWWESGYSLEDPALAAAYERALAHFADFVGATTIEYRSR